MKKIIFIVLLSFNLVKSQNINVNQDMIENYIRFSKLNGDIKSDNSLNIRPLDLTTLQIDNSDNNFLHSLNHKIISNNIINISILPLDYFIEYNSHHPHKTNNGSMIPNKGYQHIISPGIFIKFGPLEIQLKPEHHYADNLNFPGFWEGHYPVIWAKRYELWNRIDMPERFGKNRHNKLLIGQSSVKLNYKNFNLGFSNENLWWGPSMRNSIMLSNNARGFKHLFFETKKPIITKLGNFEFKLISSRLESSGFTPPNIDFEYAGRKLYVPKINQQGLTDDWRYMQALNINYSPKWIKNLNLGLIRWANMYSAVVRGKYTWMPGNYTWMPVFSNLFRKNDKFIDLEMQVDQAIGLYFKSSWIDSRAEVYGEFYYNDAKSNLRDLILDSDHSRAVTLGFNKFFLINNSDFIFSWEWTQLEQTAGRLLRNARSWYEHNFVYDGYTNNGEVIGAKIGPGSNSHFFSVKKFDGENMLGLSLEIVDNDNDFYHEAFESAKDYRRYWKDFNFNFNFSKNFKKFILFGNLTYERSLNYQWELNDFELPYYHAGKDVDNFHVNLKFSYFINSY